MKTLIAALVLSPSSKAVTVVDERQWLVVERRAEGWGVFLVDLQEGDVTHCNTKITGHTSLQSWVDNCVFDAEIDVNEKRWETLEAMGEQFISAPLLYYADCWLRYSRIRARFSEENR